MCIKDYPYERELSLVISSLKQLRIPVHLVPIHATDSFPSLDLGIHSLLYPSLPLKDVFFAYANTYQPNTIYRVYDQLYCNYISLILPQGSIPSILVIGPYIQTEVSTSQIHAIAEQSSLAPHLFPELTSFYESLTLVNNERYLLALLSSLGECMWGSRDNFSLIDQDPFIIHITEQGLSLHPTSEFEDPQILIKNIEQRYELENELLHAISIGQVHLAELAHARFISSLNSEPRHLDPIRNLKNYIVISNTLFRKAAEQGMVHPLHIDQLSSQFARKIEATDNLIALDALSKEMVRQYCLLVKNYSLKEYSELIRQTLTRITSDLTSDLTLNTLAKHLNVNASYLSSLFRKETGSTLTDYVTRKRIEHAVYLLHSTSLQISTIAQYCGIPDLQYFSKLFKKQIGISPSQYRKSITEAN